MIRNPLLPSDQELGFSGTARWVFMAAVPTLFPCPATHASASPEGYSSRSIVPHEPTANVGEGRSSF